jgi:hypothetical protein
MKDPRSKHTTRLTIDHDHMSGTIRGLLCRKCNSGIGLFEDDISRLTNAIEYLIVAKKK